MSQIKFENMRKKAVENAENIIAAIKDFENSIQQLRKGKYYYYDEALKQMQPVLAQSASQQDIRKKQLETAHSMLKLHQDAVLVFVKISTATFSANKPSILSVEECNTLKMTDAPWINQFLDTYNKFLRPTQPQPQPQPQSLISLIKARTFFAQESTYQNKGTQSHSEFVPFTNERSFSAANN